MEVLMEEFLRAWDVYVLKNYKAVRLEKQNGYRVLPDPLLLTQSFYSIKKLSLVGLDLMITGSRV